MIKYDQAFAKSDVGKLLYQRWRAVMGVGCCPEWTDFEVFAKWALDNGYQTGAHMKRRNVNEVFSPGNVHFVFNENKCISEDYKAFFKKWNRTVNRIRVHYGLEPFTEDDEEKTCKSCVHYKVCEYKANCTAICEDFL